MDKAIIFGGAGFIGTHLNNILCENNVDTINYDITYDAIQDGQKNIFVDVRRPILSSIDAKDNTAIFNFAAVHKTPGHDDYEYFETNINGAENVCDFARENNVKTIIFTSSIAPYGASENMYSEISLPTPNTPYGISKLVAEEIHKRWQSEDPSTRKLIILRPGVVFGKGESGNFTRLYNSLKKRLFVYPGRKDTLKASIYVKDLVRIMTEMIHKENPGINIYNMCYPQAYSIQDIVLEMSKVTKVSSNVLLIPGWFLKAIAAIVYGVVSVFGVKNLGIHPDRVDKLMISTNISGQKLQNNLYYLKYDLSLAVKDWFSDCDQSGLF